MHCNLPIAKAVRLNLDDAMRELRRKTRAVAESAESSFNEALEVPAFMRKCHCDDTASKLAKRDLDLLARGCWTAKPTEA